MYEWSLIDVRGRCHRGAGAAAAGGGPRAASEVLSLLSRDIYADAPGCHTDTACAFDCCELTAEGRTEIK